MKRKSVVNAYRDIQPDETARKRMLQNILLSSEIPPAGKDEPMKRRKVMRYLFVAVLLIAMLATVGVASELLKIPVKETASFVSTDGTIEFYMDIDEEVTGEVLPSVEVVPHFFTGEEAKHVASVLFGDAVFYEDEPYNTIQFSKAEIQEKLDRWGAYASEEALCDLYANQPHATDGYLERALEIVNSFIDEYNAMYDDAPADNVRTPCRWELRSSIEYMFPEDEWDEHDPEHNNWEVCANTVFNGMPYAFSMSQRDNADFRVNNINAYIYDGISPNGIDDQIYRSRLCRTPEPTQEQMDAAKQKAESWLSQMNMGSWMVDECYVRSWGTGDTTEYYICVNAVPVFNGVPAIRREQLWALRGQEEGKTYYYYTDVKFEFSANGELLNFKMYSPVDVVDSSYEKQGVSVQELMEIAKSHLADSNYSDYSYIPEAYEGMLDMGCKIRITGLDYSLNRTSDEDDRSPFVYSLGVSLSGSIEYYDKATGETVDLTEDRIILVLDGMDGIFLANG